MISSLRNNTKQLYTQAIGYYSPYYMGPYIVPNLKDFVWYNQRNASATQQQNSINFLHTDEGSQDRHSWLMRPLIHTPPYTITTIFSMRGEGTSYSGYLFGLAIGNSGANLRHQQFYVNADPAIGAVNMLNMYSATNNGAGAKRAYITPTFTNFNFIGMRITDDGINRKWWVSGNGKSWGQTYTEATNTDVTPNEVGFASYCSNANTSASGNGRAFIYHLDVTQNILGDL